MKLERSKNTIRNIKVNLINKIIGLLGPFLIRTVFIRTIGVEYLGVNSLFSSVLSVLNLAELGVASAIAFNMYSAISKDDDKQICALLYSFRKIYRYIGLVILLIGLALIPFLQYLVKGSYPPDINPTIVYVIFLLNTVLSYFMYAYLNSLLNAFQRNDLTILVMSIMNIFMYVIQTILLINVRNYYVYILIMPVFTILTNLCTAIVAKKTYPQYIPCGELDIKTKENVKEKVKGLFIHNVSAITRNSFDSIFISMFLGLSQVAIYNNYYYIMISVVGIINILTSSMLAGVGNSVASETTEKNYSDMKKINFIYMWISGWGVICLLCLYQPFMEIWMGEKLMLPFSSVILFCMYFYLLKMGDIRCLYADANGLWWRQRYPAILEAVLNLILNYLLGKFLGLNGIVLATLISMFTTNFCYRSTILFKYYFGIERCKEFFKFHAKTFLVVVICSVATYLVCQLIPNGIVYLLLKLCMCLIIPNLMMWFLYRKTKLYQESLTWLFNHVGISNNSFIYKKLIGREQ